MDMSMTVDVDTEDKAYLEMNAQFFATLAFFSTLKHQFNVLSS